jgi:ELWxxDGT repeat protein
MKNIFTTIATALTLLPFITNAQVFQLVEDLEPTGSAQPQAYTKFNNKLYFGARTNNTVNLWATDGTNAGTQQISSASNSSFDAVNTKPTLYNGKMIFTGYDTTGNQEPFITDGTVAGTVILKNINPTVASTPQEYTLYNGYVIFAANDGTNGTELWRTDGTGAGTILVKDINPSGDSYPHRFKEYNGILYFLADDNTSGPELWRTDGTNGGTYLVKDIYTGQGGSFAADFVVYNGYLYFDARDDVNGYELWRTDGTTAGTVMFMDIAAGADGSGPQSFALYNNQLFFVADDGIHGGELWKTDGTTAGTVMVKDIHPIYGSDIYDVVPAAGKLFFVAETDTDGPELWVSDGTNAGTTVVKNINPDGGANVSYLYAYNNQLFFTADDGDNGMEVWVTDGTLNGTIKLANPDNENYSPLANCFGFIDYNGEIYYAANYNSAENELWKLTLSPNGIDNINQADVVLTAYPNPCTNAVTFTGLPHGANTVRIMAVDGREMISETTTALPINTTGLPAGIYIAEVVNNGKQVSQTKFVKANN